MRIHTSLTEQDMRDAARLAGVQFERLAQHGSRSRDHAFDFILTGSSGRRGNFGGDYEAATWDEWGIVLGELFRRDPNAHCGKNSYESGEHFRWVTGGRFDTLTPADQHRNHKWEYSGVVVTGSYHVAECSCGAIQRWLALGHRFADLSTSV